MAAAPLFICHALADAAFAEDLALALETCRLRVWRDTHQLRGSDRLSAEVRWAIEQARQVIVVLGLNTGDPAWLRREIEVAQEVERRRNDAYRVLPLLLPGSDPAILADWFSPLPRITPIQLTADGLGAALPTLLAALGESPPGDPATDRNRRLLNQLELSFSRAEPPDAWRIAARLHRGIESTTTSATITLGSLPQPPAAKLLRWYWHSYPCWPLTMLDNSPATSRRN